MIFRASQNFFNDRIYGFDYLRVFSTVLVVAIHTFDTNISLSNVISYFEFPVPVFLMISFFLLFRKVYYGTNNIYFYFKQRCLRLLPCFLLWTLLYLFVRVIAQSNLSWSWDAIVGYLFFGTAAVHLYYLPLTIYYCIILLPFILICRKQKIFYSTVSLGLIIIAAIAIKNIFLISNYRSLLSNDLRIFLQYATSYFIYSILGVYFAYLMVNDKAEDSKIKVFKSIPIIIFIIVAFIEFRDNGNLQYLQILINLFIFAFGYYFYLPHNKVISYLAKISFGIYLSHHLFIELFQIIEQGAGYNLNSFSLTIINFLLATFISIVFSSCLYKVKKTQFLVA